jgi:phytoene desaturase
MYVCVANRTDPCLAPPGHDAIYVLVPAPHLSDRVDWEVEREPFRRLVYDRLEAVGLEDLRRHVVFERVYTPQDFAADYNLTHGSAFGLSHGFWQVGYMRPSNKAPGLDNVYFVGASTVPGGGVPMVIIGSRLTAERIQAEGHHA